MMSQQITMRINGEEEALRLTLGALASIEEAFGGDIESLANRLRQPRVSDIALVLHALLIGGGSALTLEALRASDIDIAEAARAIAKTFEALGRSGEAPGQDAPGKPERGARTTPQPASGAGA